MIHLVDDPRYREHTAPPGHPEAPERLAAVARAVAEFAPSLTPLASRAAEIDELGRIHSRALIDQLQAAARRAPTQIDADTYLSRSSYDVAALAAGSAIDLCASVASGRASAGLAAIRPPGHHAEASQAMGFCLFNNVAIAARALQASHGVGKLMIVDFDVHHGNGTQHSFERDPSVLYVSTHQFPYYPGTGAFREAGIDAGVGTTLNIPLPAGSGDAEYIGVFQRLLVPAARHFGPEMILVSAGFDAHAVDPLASMDVTRAGYRAMADILLALAGEICAGKIVFLLEGGYAPQGLYEGTRAVLEALTNKEGDSLPALAEAPHASTLAQVVARVVEVHGSMIPGLGAP